MDAITAVIGGHDQFIARRFHFFFQDNQGLGPGADDGGYPVAGFLEGFRNGIDDAHPYPAADTDDMAVVFYFRRVAKRSLDILNVIADIQRRHQRRRLAHNLKNDGDGSLLPIRINDGQRDPLPLLVDLEDHELAGLTLPGNLRR